MMSAGGLGGLLLLLAAPTPTPLPSPPSPAVVAHQLFAPPVGRPLAYHVTTRRLGRSGAMISFTLVYALQWQRSGRGYQLAATLQRIDSDARPAIVRMATAALQPLVGETLTYLVAPDGSQIEMIDSEGLWERVAERTQAAAAGAEQAEARQVAQMLAGLSAEERSQLASADIRALVAPANADIPAAGAANVSVTHDDGMRTVAKAERDTLAVGAGARPLEVDHRWTIDAATGLVMREQRESWIIEPESKARTLVEERLRVLQSAPNP